VMICNLSSRAFLMSESRKNFFSLPDSIESSLFSLVTPSHWEKDIVNQVRPHWD
jgi:hypothetical protein